MCVDPILWNCVRSRSYDFSRVWWVRGWERGPPPRRPHTNIWTPHTALESWNLGLFRDVWSVQIFVRGRRVAEEWCGPWCSNPTIYDLPTRLSFSLTRVSTLGHFDLRWLSSHPNITNSLSHRSITNSCFASNTSYIGDICTRYQVIHRSQTQRVIQTSQTQWVVSVSCFASNTSYIGDTCTGYQVIQTSQAQRVIQTSQIHWVT